VRRGFGVYGAGGGAVVGGVGSTSRTVGKIHPSTDVTF
jgi:hypothetical protein